MFNFENLVCEVLNEDVLAGGITSAFGPGVTSTETPFSGDNYAPGDARTPRSLYGGVMTRFGMSKKKKSVYLTGKRLKKK